MLLQYRSPIVHRSNPVQQYFKTHGKDKGIEYTSGFELVELTPQAS